MKLVLFDIDLTLITTGGAGTAALDRAFKERFGIERATSGYSPDGKTDPLIVRELMRLHGAGPETDEMIAGMLGRYVSYLREEMEKGTRGCVNPGVREVLSGLASMKGVGTGLLTGNIREGASIKLEPYGIAGFFEFGAFGDDAELRERLLPIAVKRAGELYGCAIDIGPNIFVVGDTPFDVAAARPHGAVSVAVATGRCSVEELARCSPDRVFSDLSDYEGFLKLVEEGPQRVRNVERGSRQAF